MEPQCHTLVQALCQAKGCAGHAGGPATATHGGARLRTGSEQDQLTLENAVSDLAAALTDLCLTPTHAVMHIPWHGGCRVHWLDT
jgi:hypothetical protein